MLSLLFLVKRQFWMSIFHMIWNRTYILNTLQIKLYHIIMGWVKIILFWIHTLKFKYGIICWGIRSTVRNYLHNLYLCKPIIKSLNVLTLTLYIYLNVHCFKRKTIVNLLKNKVYHQYVTKNYDGLETKSHRTYLIESSPDYSCVKIFNHISNYIKNLLLTIFKRKLSAYLIKKCFYTLDENRSTSTGKYKKW